MNFFSSRLVKQSVHVANRVGSVRTFAAYKEVTPEMKRKNVILATSLFGFIVSVYYYSMEKVKKTVSILKINLHG
jgi:hypothetical protein